ncbi:quinone oxidoreductase family protein [Hyphococcus sp.]|uniref:quinone oxidoreductase family protein n=1 Tax=Hyphococcus sp. TaxID=2038636 RepID=UPI0020842A3B|nr:MAG: alcohol dehydrogenase [Marinicaulis sp.]
MTKAVYLEAHGGPEGFALRDFDPPPPDAGQLRVRHTAIGLNFIDIYKRTGLYPASLPAILGSEAAGVVEATGGGVEGFKPGDRIAHIGGSAYAEIANVPAVLAAKIPDSVSDEFAAAVFLKGLTVDMLVNQVFALKPGDSCLVHAAAGGVGTLLCQWANHLGARVIAVVGSQEKETGARANGAHEVIIRTQTDSIAAELRRLTKNEGVAVVYDSVGEATFTASLDSLAMRGHMVTFGNASGPVPPVAPLELSRRGSLTLTRPTLFHYATPERMPDMAARLFKMVAEGAVLPKIGGRFTLAEIAEAHRLLESGQSQGAIVLNP